MTTSSKSSFETASISSSISSRPLQHMSFLVDDHPIRSLEVPMSDHIGNLHHLVLLIVKLDRAIAAREVRATMAGRSYVDGLHSCLTKAMKGEWQQVLLDSCCRPIELLTC